MVDNNDNIDNSPNNESEGSNENSATTDKSVPKNEQFAHLGKRSSVGRKKSNKMVMLGVVGAGVLFIIFMMSLSGHHHKTTQKHHDTLGNDNDMTFANNAKRLAELRNRNNNKPTFSIIHSDTDKAMQVRQNAPTQMYVATMQTQLGTNGTGGQASTLAGQGQFSKFANTQSGNVGVVHGTKIKHPHYTIAEGEFIGATLETAINSDLPGMVRATITRPVYGYVGEAPLISAGSRLIGQYSALASNGAASARVFIMWNRVVTPKGISIMLNSPGVDALGRAGAGADAVDTHFFKMFGTAALLSIMGATAATSGVNSTTQPNSANQYQQAVASAFTSAAQNSLSQNLNIKPTLHIHQGNAINVFVAHDLDLYSVLANG